MWARSCGAIMVHPSEVQHGRNPFVGLAYQGKDIVFKFIMSIVTQGILVPRSIFVWGFLTDDILACVETWD